LNIINGGTLTINSYGQSQHATYFAGQSNVAMSMGTVGNYSVLNVIDSTFNNAVSSNATSNYNNATQTNNNTNDAINLAGVTGGGGSQNSLTTGMLTGILNINVSSSRFAPTSSIVRTGYVRAGDITFAGTPTNTAAGAPTGYTRSSWLRFRCNQAVRGLPL
jgi:hypothetical protein